MQPNWVTDQRQQRIIKYILLLMLTMLGGLPLGVLLVLGIGVPLWVLGIGGGYGVLLMLLGKYTPVGRLSARLSARLAPFQFPTSYSSTTEIKCVEKIRWSWAAVRFNKRLMLFGPLTAGLLVGLGVGIGGLDEELSFGLGFGLRAALALLVGLFAGLVAGLVVGLGVGIIGLCTGFSIGEIALHSFPNEGIKRSMQNGLLSGLGAGLFFGLFAGLVAGLGAGLFFGLLAGLGVGLGAGGQTCLHHFALRLVLWHNNFAPLNYIGFLDYAAARIFLRKVGGGYVFVHRMLLEYFAARHQTSDERHN